MAKIIRMPEVAANATSAMLVAWTKNEGDLIAVGDCIAEIETDKAVIEFEADEAGVMGKILVKPGVDVQVGAPIAVLLKAGEENVDVQALLAETQGVSEGVSPAVTTLDPSDTDNIVEKVSDSKAVENTNDQNRIFASPLAKRIAKQEGLDLGSIIGSGPNGRIVKRDVYEMMSLNQARQAEQLISAKAENVKAGYTATPHSNMRKAIARRMVESKTTTPHFYLRNECNMSNLLSLRQQINSNASKKVSVNDFIIKAVSVALGDVPKMNVSWTDDALHQYESVDISVAVSTERGLITPVVQDVQNKSVSIISRTIADLAQRAKDGKLAPTEYQGGSFTVSNLGMFGVQEFLAIINPPQAAILAVGAIEERVVVVNGEIVAAPMMTLTLSVDHRAIDGALAAEWLGVLKKIIENPLLALI